MHHYIDRTHVELMFGADNVAAWSNMDNDQAAGGDQRVQQAIAWAESYIDSRFAPSCYRVPLRAIGVSGPPTLVQDWAAALAGWWLQRPRHPKPQQLHREFLAIVHQIDQMVAGRARMPALLAGSQLGARVVD
jgi:hypothetical protein